MAKLSKAKQQDRNEAIEELRHLLKPGDTVYCIVRSVARSGMSRDISLLIPCENGERMLSLTWLAARAIGWRINDGRPHWSIKVHGCGMDMCWHTVYTLGRVLWPNGTDKPHGTRNGQPDSDGGYALRAESL